MLVGPRGTDQAADLGHHQLGFLLGFSGTVEVVGDQPPQTGSEFCALGRTARMADETPLVDLVRDEPTHVRMHASGLPEEDTAVRRHGRLTPKDMLEHAESPSTWMRGLGHLR